METCGEFYLTVFQLLSLAFTGLCKTLIGQGSFWKSNCAVYSSKSSYMARVILDVPSEKMGSFIRAIMQLGIDKHSISSEREAAAASARPERESLFSGKRFKNFTSKLFDWDRNRNELEFE